MEFVIINLKESNDRLKKQEEHYKSRTLQRFEAIKGSEIKTDILLSTFCSNFCSDSMIGCGLSHINIWKQISNIEEEKIFIIHEDDVFIDFENIEKFDFKKIFKNHNIDILHIARINNKKIENTFVEKIDDTFNLYKSSILGTGAYVITPHSAKNLLKKIKSLKYHIDVQIYISSVNQYVIYPYLAFVDGKTTSTQSSHDEKYLLKYLKNNSLFKNMYFILKMPIFSFFRLFNINLYMILIIIFIFGIRKFLTCCFFVGLILGLFWSDS